MRLGLTQHCQVIYGRTEICTFPRISLEWMLTLVLISFGIMCLTVTCVLQILSHWKRNAIKYARWIAFTASKLLYKCLLCTLFLQSFQFIHFESLEHQNYLSCFGTI
jgi:hypothetical protein